MNEQEKQLMLDIHNRNRTSPLLINERLERAAQSHAENMKRMGKMNHRGLSNRVRGFNYNFSSVAENVARGQNSVEQVMNSWLRSRGHARNIKGNYSEVGFGRSGNFWCVIFANPRN